MANKFPHCQVLGIDLAIRELDEDKSLSNLSFEVHDVNNGLDKFHAQFDFIHVRLIQAGTKDFVRFQHDVEACLKPGGMVVFIDADWRNYAKDGVTAARIPDTDENGYAIKPVIQGSNENDSAANKPSWFRKIRTEAINASCLTGSDNMKYITDRGLWHHPLCDPNTASAATVLIPIGPWATGKYLDILIIYYYFPSSGFYTTSNFLPQLRTQCKLKAFPKLES